MKFVFTFCVIRLKIKFVPSGYFVSNIWTGNHWGHLYKIIETIQEKHFKYYLLVKQHWVDWKRANLIVLLEFFFLSWDFKFSNWLISDQQLAPNKTDQVYSLSAPTELVSSDWFVEAFDFFFFIIFSKKIGLCSALTDRKSLPDTSKYVVQPWEQLESLSFCRVKFRAQEKENL